MISTSTPCGTRHPSTRQRSLRRRLGARSFPAAVRLAASAYFRFTHRASNAAALWSERERVWMGSQTFLAWSEEDPGIDIPWTVACAHGAPSDATELHAAVRRELIAYWQGRIDGLPRAAQPNWIPLP